MKGISSDSLLPFPHLLNKNKKQQAQINLDAKKAITNALYDISCLQEVHKVDDLTRPEIFYKVLEKAETNLRNQPQGDLFVEEKIAELKEVAEAVIVDYKDNIIETLEKNIKRENNFRFIS